ncbi:hypothetical protein D9M68_808320 [compost metagenome]
MAAAHWCSGCCARCRRFEATAQTALAALAEPADSSRRQRAPVPTADLHRADAGRAGLCPGAAADAAGRDQLPEQPGLCPDVSAGVAVYRRHPAHLPQPGGSGAQGCWRALGVRRRAGAVSPAPGKQRAGAPGDCPGLAGHGLSDPGCAGAGRQRVRAEPAGAAPRLVAAGALAGRESLPAGLPGGLELGRPGSGAAGLSATAGRRVAAGRRRR